MRRSRRLVWFKAGGTAEWLFEPADAARSCATSSPSSIPDVPVMALGLGSNLIVRDGGVPGVVVRLGKPFATIEQLDATTLRCGGGASGILVSSTARDAGIAGLEFLRGIPGTVGGFVRMNGGAYGREVKDILGRLRARAARAAGVDDWPLDELGYTYRHSELPEGASSSTPPSAAMPGDPAAIQRRDGPDRRAPARRASRCAAAPAARPSRTRPAPRPGG